MKTTIILKDHLIKEAMAVTGIKEKTAVIHRGLEELINNAARQRLIKLGGKLKTAQAPRRRRIQ
jgi:Arc/MetJ family transcription regulator